MLKAERPPGEGGRGGEVFDVDSTSTAGDLSVPADVICAVQGGSGGAPPGELLGPPPANIGGAISGSNRRPRAVRKRRQRPRPTQRLAFWHDLFRHINASCLVKRQTLYPWMNADRKILANAARKYGTPAIMALWDLFEREPGAWHQKSGGTIYGMVRDAARLLDHPDFKYLAGRHQARLESEHGWRSADEVLTQVGLL